MRTACINLHSGEVTASLSTPTKPGKVTIAGHPSEEMSEGTCKSILKQAGLQK